MIDSCRCGEDCPVWQSQDGDIYICEMSTDHLRNALRWLRRKRQEVGCYWPQGEMAQVAAQQAEDEMDRLDDAMSSELDKRTPALVGVNTDPDPFD